jgi:GntR family transcriptional regulator, transcriptional repressor for pyruvate dehydrogenase complex
MNRLDRHPTIVAGSLFERVDRGIRLSDKVAQQLLDSIVSGRLRPGDQLPSERELADNFGVSRTVIREAVRSLLTRGLLVSQSGSRLRVTAMVPGSVTEWMSLLVSSIGSVGYTKVHEVRTVLEMATVGLAAERATAEEVSILGDAARGLLRADLTPVDAARYDTTFHRVLAEATKNELFVVLLDSIGDVLFEVRLRFLSDRSGVDYAYGAHKRILERVADHDIEGARAAMFAHLEESRDLLGQVHASTD